MTSNKICLNCGCSSFVSDRSLGGKMVCLKCGSSAFRNKSFNQITNKKLFYFFIGIVVLFLIIF